ncbi:MAG: AbrB/MazE/SpoVT family DNA-binding domain-containing protein [Candidatus Marinimicrobia bacterium]|nr:AbrB/MazE/SpoVT family DNA-binding domain-containing protein [Candidatus Neomarinimicrobiota bacterium]
MKRKIIRVGSSRGVLLPREVTKAMNWEFGSQTELTVDEDMSQVILKTIKIDIPDDYNPEHLKQIERTLKNNFDVLGGLDD